MLKLTQFKTIFVAFLIFISACKKSNKNQTSAKINPEFGAYISAFTSGMVSTHSSVKIRLVNPVNYSSNDKEYSNLFQISPSIKGEVRWIDEQTIEFVPEKPFEQDKIYRVKFFLHKLIQDLPKEFSVFEFEFKTLQQHLQVEVEQYKTYSKKDLSWLGVKLKITLSDQALDEEVYKIISATQELKNLSLQWLEKEGDKIYFVQIDSISRKEKASKIEINYDGKSIGAEEKNSIVLDIPALGDFKLVHYNIISDPNQYISLQFSDPLMDGQNLKGLITIEGFYGNISFSIEDNEIKAYLPYRINGQRKLNVFEGIKNSMGYPFLSNESIILNFENLKPSIRLIGNGVIVPNSQGLFFPFEAVNLSSVDIKVTQIFSNNVNQFFQVNNIDGNYELRRVGKIIFKGNVKLISDVSIDYNSWNSFKIDLSKYINIQPGAIYNVELSFKKKYSLYPCDNQQDEDNEMEELPDNWDDPMQENEQSYWDYYDDYYYDDEDYDYSKRDDPCHSMYYRQQRRVSKNVFSSNLGIIAKRSDKNSISVAVSNLLNADPEASVNIEIFNFQNQLLGSTTTNSDGMAQLNVSGKPFLLIAKKGDQVGYLRMDDGSSLSLSMFQTSGSSVKEGLKGFLYGERGVWRPGDTLFLTFLLEDKLKTLPIGHPVILELYNPLGQLYKKLINNKPVQSFYHFPVTTESSVPTGSWIAKVRVGGAIFEEMLKIETIKPNRLKIAFNPSQKILKVGDEIAANLQVKWLHGAVAKELDANIKANVVKSSTKFSSFTDYNFDNPAIPFDPEEIEIFEGSLNELGEAEVNNTLSISNEAPGMLKANFLVRVFESGGDFSIDQFSIPVSPYKSYVGVKMPAGDKARGMLLTDTTHQIQIATITEDGKPIAKKDLKVTIYKITWRWWWENQSGSSVSEYVGRNEYSIIASGTANTNTKGMGTFPFKITYPEWGRYLVEIEDTESGHKTGQIFYADWPGWAGRAQRENNIASTMLTFTSDKTNYKVGEKAQISIPTTAGARALLSIENGSKVLRSVWIETQDKFTQYALDITEEMTPNVYVHITLIHPHQFSKNDLPLRMYGILPIMVENPANKLLPIISMPNELQPEQKFDVKIKEQNGKAMTYSLAIVDEGLLDLTRFKTPDPYAYFYAKEALGIKTWDMYNDVMGGLTGELKSLLAAGGDDEVKGKKGSKVQRFKPVVKYLGPFTLKPGEIKTHAISLPNYVGSVRTMVVAAENNAYGHAEKSTPVRKPLMILATAPRLCGPGETFQLPVTIFTSEKSIKNVTVNLKTNDIFKVQESSSKNVSFSNPGEETVSFALSTIEKTGVGKIEVIASGANFLAKYTIDIEVRASNPYITKVTEEVIEGGTSKSLNYELFGISGTNRGSIEFSSIPPLDLERRLNYLMQYPHGCIEQTTSSVFPQLFLSHFVDLSSEEQQKISNNIKAGIQRLRTFQQLDGAFSYWPGASDGDSWGSNYAIHFLLEAEKKGFALPTDMKSKMIASQKKKAQQWKANAQRYYNEDLIQAYRLYTLALAGQSDLGSMNRLREKKNLDNTSKWRLAAAYLLAGQKDAANKLIETSNTQVAKYNELSYTYGSDIRDKAMILETIILTGNIAKSKPLMDEIAASLRSNQWMSTQSTAYSLLAISKFLDKNKMDKSILVNFDVNGKNAQTINTGKPLWKKRIAISSVKNGKINIKNNAQGIVYARLFLEGVPLQGKEIEASNTITLNVSYYDMQGSSIDVTSLAQGTDFIAKVSVSNMGGRGDLNELVLTQIFPSGWEIMNTRFLQDFYSGQNKKSAMNSFDYQDVRDDRVYTYFDMKANTTLTFTVHLNAAYIGRYYLPAVQCEAMYDVSINANNVGKWVEVLDQANLGL